MGVKDWFSTVFGFYFVCFHKNWMPFQRVLDLVFTVRIRLGLLDFTSFVFKGFRIISKSTGISFQVFGSGLGWIVGFYFIFFKGFRIISKEYQD
jgi:hypothetical protein